jgi:5-deoxy-glucuronate isomerase
VSPVTGTLHIPAGTAVDGAYALSLTPEQAGWTYSGLKVLALEPGGQQELATGEDEVLVLPLAGSCTVECEGERYALVGRADVFSGVTDLLYLPRDTTATVASEAGGRFALPSARAARRLAPRYLAASEVPVELRGAGTCSRQVNNFCTPQSLEADRMIAVEVLTPAGNWSSYPPHKHDESRPGEAILEEIYYYELTPEREAFRRDAGGEVAGAGQKSVGGEAAGDALGGDTGGGAPRGAGDPIGYQRVYGSAGRPIDVLAEVRDGDVVLVPHGWHGPSMATPGYHLYYLNVMAGPGDERAWLISDDPVHAWVRGTWDDQALDPRLPLTTAEVGRTS